MIPSVFDSNASLFLLNLCNLRNLRMSLAVLGTLEV